MVGSHNYVIQKDARFIINSAIASMGYGLPAAIGACVANDRKDTICIEGDGSIMMNLQELQTVLTNKLPIKLFLINNQGYHSVRRRTTCSAIIARSESDRRAAICHSRSLRSFLRHLDTHIIRHTATKK